MNHHCHHQHQHTDGAEQATWYTCPMHPTVRETAPGMCPECGMNLVEAKSKKEKGMGSPHTDHVAHEGGFDKHAGHHTDDFLKKFIISAVLTVPVVLLSDVAEVLFGRRFFEFPGAPYLAFALGSLVFFYGGWVFLAGAWRELRARLPGMMTLIALATSAAYLWSVYVLLTGIGSPLWWELTTLITVMLLGHWLEMRAVKGASSALRELSKLLPDTAEVVKGDATVVVPLSELKEGDVVFVRPGGRIPADGVVHEGRAEVNESMVTGESAPVLKAPGATVIAGTANGDGALRIEVAKIGEHTFLAGVMRLVKEAQASKSRLQLLSDRAALYLTFVATIGGGVTLAVWLAVGAPAGFAVERLVAVLVIACPHALGLAVPLVASLSTTIAARHGFLIKQRLALEAARNVDIVLFDKTGTLTKGEYGITDIWPVAAKDENELLALAAAVDAHSEHFIARAILDEAHRRAISIPPARDFSRVPGKGVRGTVGSSVVYVGGEQIIEEMKVRVTDEIARRAKEEGAKGKTVVYVLRDRDLLGAFALADLIREESREAIAALREKGVEVAMLTGDTEAVAAWVARELGIEKVFARVLPGEKSEKVKLLQREGKRVAMVGDGVNDAPALTQADVGIAIGAGTNIAVESAGIILVRNDPRDIPKIIALSHATYRKMIQNLWWATGYNLAALPLAAGVLAGQGIILPPAVAAVFMSLSTVIVAVNALLLRRVRLGVPR
ncbi:MAG: heavy metal translocating P-type ATPase [Candidatus Jorgensenbacteria bacterium]|nr:heavy metal translocating P-type ATPase [Candidatus Jorgensenbacteria bacterium]